MFLGSTNKVFSFSSFFFSLFFSLNENLDKNERKKKKPKKNIKLYSSIHENVQYFFKWISRRQWRSCLSTRILSCLSTRILEKKNENILNIWISTDGISADGVFTVSVLTNCVFTDGTIFKTINIIIVVEMNIIHDETATTYAVDELEK